MGPGTMSSDRVSLLLTREEMEMVSRLLGNRCQALAMGIVQLFFTESPDHSTWRKHDSGVLCLVKDSQRRSYFFRLYCIIRRQMVWEHEVYNSLDYNSPRPFFHMFEAEDGIAAFNFASEDEAHFIKCVLMEKLEAKQRRLERRNRHTVSGMNQHIQNPTSVIAPGGDSNLSNGMTIPLPQTKQHAPSGSDKRKEKDLKRKLTKADIGLPQHFRHISHVGWDPDKGFDLDKVDDPQLKQFFVKAGVSDSQLQDRETREFIYDFIIRHGGLDAVKEEFVHPSVPHTQPPGVPPPVPARTAPSATSSNYLCQTRSAPPPPPPPSRSGPLPPPPPISQPVGPPRLLSKSTSPNPPQISGVASPPPAPPPILTAPPPPPPPPTFQSFDTPSLPPIGNNNTNNTNNTISPPDTRSALMDAIRTGKSLKHVEVDSKRSSSGDSRGDLLDQIRQGVELKSVQPIPRPAQNTTPQNGLAGALARALAERSRVIHSDSSASSGDEEEDDDEWED